MKFSSNFPEIQSMFTFLCHTISITPARKNPDNDKVPQNEVLIFDLQKWTDFNPSKKTRIKSNTYFTKHSWKHCLIKIQLQFWLFLKDFGSIVHQQQLPLVSRSKSNSTMSGAKKKCTSSTTFIQTIAVCNNESLKIPTCNNGKSSA